MPAQIKSDLLLRRKELSKKLTERGYPVAANSLATMATRGGGPPYRKFGRAVLYPWQEALEWAERRLGPLLQSSSEAGRPPDR